VGIINWIGLFSDGYVQQILILLNDGWRIRWSWSAAYYSTLVFGGISVALPFVTRARPLISARFSDHPKSTVKIRVWVAILWHRLMASSVLEIWSLVSNKICRDLFNLGGWLYNHFNGSINSVLLKSVLIFWINFFAFLIFIFEYSSVIVLSNNKLNIEPKRMITMK